MSRRNAAVRLPPGEISMRILLTVCAFALLLVSSAGADPFLIVPGRSLGRTHLGRNGAYYLSQLPSPDGAEATMGGARYLAWKSNNRNTLAIFAVSQEFDDPPSPGMTIREIRTTSSRFHTQTGVSPGATLAQIKHRFSRGQLEPTNDQTSWFYTVSQGIAFEFRSRPASASRCLAVNVFPSGRRPQLPAQEVKELLDAGRLERKPRREGSRQSITGQQSIYQHRCPQIALVWVLKFQPQTRRSVCPVPPHQIA